ncbi:methionine adenosyltransferase [Allorhizocola rhizosphaerae]|uniref:methionine adenosyltransferase n=1 Tax=Allorhizocola rhizosphaerae TaxID=1872709 RepID=UPI000E3BCD17|nr:methionine adenosyltransferase [Allorhizocola rhizosphaerae]
MSKYFFTSESVAEGHPDKVCDLVADTVLDAYLEQDPGTRAGCEVLYKGDLMVVAGEFTSTAHVPVEELARQVVAEVGYVPGKAKHNSETVRIQTLITEQSREIRAATDRAADAPSQRGASDQGIMFGMACDDTPELMPLPIMLAHTIGKAIVAARKSGEVEWLRPDGKTAVTVQYEDEKPVAVTNVVVAAQHAPEITHAEVTDWVTRRILPGALGAWLTDATAVHVNPLGTFTLGGPEIDCGMTGRKIVVDTYGGSGRIGGGALSGKDPSKLDRTGTYFCRWVAKQLVAQGIAHKVELQIAYGFGLAKPLSVRVDTFGTGDAAEAGAWVERFDFRPGAMAEVLDLAQPIYRSATNYGHFGKPDLPWERLPDA